MEGKAVILAGSVALALVFAIAGILFPSPVVRGGRSAAPPAVSPAASPDSAEPQGASLPQGRSLRVLLPDGSVVRLELEEYLWGVLAAEMPASFLPAALEAQAVAARTYALHRANSSPHSPQADLCSDPTCCQGYLPRPPESWGENTTLYQRKLRAAVAATAGEVLTQDGTLIDAVFHASSAGSTAPAQAVWGTAVPYLVSVSTPETAQTVPDLREEVAFTPQELEERLGAAEIGAATYQDWGGVDTLEVGGVTLSGREVRQRLGLRSTRFQVEEREGQTVFITMGYGHGVGMSQQGANLMAKDGSSYRDILAHYYPGTALEACWE